MRGSAVRDTTEPSPVVLDVTRVENTGMMRFARCLLAALAVVTCAIFPIDVASAASKGMFRIGLLDPSTGPLAAEGGEVDAGFRYYLATHGDQLGGFIGEDAAGLPGAAA